MSLSSNIPTPQQPGPAANQQQGLNTLAAEQSQAGSMVNQTNPYGSLTYSKQTDPSTGKPITGPGGIPLYSSTTTLNPQQQSLLNTLVGTQQAAGSAGQNLIKNANYGGSNPTDVIGNMQKGLEGQQLSGYLQSMNPFFTTQHDQLDTQLRNQGLMPGSPGYDNAMRTLTTNTDNAVAGAASNYANNAFNQASSLYQMPVSMGASLAALGQPGSVNQSLVQTPGLSNQAPDYLGAVSNYNNSAITAANAQAQQQTNLMNALMSPVSTALGGWAYGGFKNPFSDRRLKKNIHRIGELENGLAVYRFSYIWDQDIEHVGLMADEVEKIHPEAISEWNGYKAVDYGLAVQ